jgi:hypothetical protein
MLQNQTAAALSAHAAAYAMSAPWINGASTHNGYSVQRGFGGNTQTLDLVLELKLLALQFREPEIVPRRGADFSFDLFFDRLVAAFELGQMGLQCHAVPPVFSDVISLTQSRPGREGRFVRIRSGRAILVS